MQEEEEEGQEGEEEGGRKEKMVVEKERVTEVVNFTLPSFKLIPAPLLPPLHSIFS